MNYLRMRASAVRKSQGHRNLAPWETQYKAMEAMEERAGSGKRTPAHPRNAPRK